MCGSHRQGSTIVIYVAGSVRSSLVNNAYLLHELPTCEPTQSMKAQENLGSIVTIVHNPINNEFR